MVVGFIRRVPVLGYLLNLPGISSVSLVLHATTEACSGFYSTNIAYVEMQQK